MSAYLILLNKPKYASYIDLIFNLSTEIITFDEK